MLSLGDSNNLSSLDSERVLIRHMLRFHLNLHILNHLLPLMLPMHYLLVLVQFPQLYLGIESIRGMELFHVIERL